MLRTGWIESPAAPPLMGSVYTRLTDVKDLSQDSEDLVELRVEQIVPGEWRQTINDVVVASGAMSLEEAMVAVERFFEEVLAPKVRRGLVN